MTDTSDRRLVNKWGVDPGAQDWRRRLALRGVQSGAPLNVGTGCSSPSTDSVRASQSDERRAANTLTDLQDRKRLVAQSGRLQKAKKCTRYLRCGGGSERIVGDSSYGRPRERAS